MKKTPPASKSTECLLIRLRRWYEQPDNTALQFNNQTAVGKYFTEVMHNSTTDMPTLKAVIGSVIPGTDVSTPQVIAALIGVEVPTLL